MTTWIKICGLTNATDAMLAASLGANALGFVFHPASQRFCPPNAARAIIGSLPPQVITVGVWFDETADDVSALAKHVRCNCVQTYNPLTAGRLQAEGFEVIPAIPAGNDAFTDAQWRLLCKSWTGRMIIDGSRSRRDGAAIRGGWSGELSMEVWHEVNSLFPPSARVVLAGGLTPDNVCDRLERYRPAGVDVASGVEADAGRKDPGKSRLFFEEVRRWDARVGSISTAGNLSQRP